MAIDSIAEKVVSIALDNKDFVDGAEETMSTLDKLEDSFSGLGSNISTKALDDFINALTDTTHNAEIAVNTVVVRITDSVMNAVSKITNAVNQVTFDPIFSGFSKYEQQVASVQTMMTATGKSIDTVSEQLQKLMWFADETSYSYSQMSDSVGKFVSAGADLDDAVTALIGIANWAGAAGVNANEASRAMYNLAQAMGSGAVTRQDWISINTANMNTEDFKNAVIETAKEYKSWGKKYSEFVKQYGIDSSKFREMAEQNGHTVEEATKYYEYFTTAKLPKDLKNWSDLTAANFESTLSTKWFTSDILLNTLKKYGNYTEDLYRIYNEGDFDTANDAIKAYKDQYSGLIDQLFDIYTEFGKNSKQFKDFINENTMTMQTALDLVDTRSNQIFNLKLEKDADEFAELAEKYGRESQNLADAAKKSGYTLSEALDIIDNGTENYKKKEMSRGEEGFIKGQEAKTFTDAWGSAIEATSSQWLTFWQTVFGDYEEAKVTWTALSNTLWDVFAGPLERLNEIAAVWKELEGRTSLLDSVSNIWGATQRLFEPIQNAFDSIFPFFSNAERMGEVVSNLTNEFKTFTESLGISTNTFIYLRVIAESVFTTIKNVIGIVFELRQGIANIVSALIPEGNGVISFIAELSINLFKLEEYVDDLSILIGQKVGTIIGKITELKAKIVPVIEDFKNTILFITGFTDGLSVDFLDKLADNKYYNQILKIKESIDKLKASFAVLIEQIKSVDTSPFKKIVDTLKPVVDFIGDKLTGALLFAIQLIVEIMNLLVRFAARLAGFKDSWDSSIGTTLKNLFNLDGFIETIKSFFNAIAPAVNMVVETIKRVCVYIIDAVSKIDLFKAAIAAAVLQITGVTGSLLTVFKDDMWLPFTNIGQAIKNFFKFDTVKDTIKKFSGFIQGVIGEITNTLNQIPYLESVSKLLRSLGQSLLMIAGAAVLFSSISDPGAFVGAIGAITAAISGMYVIIQGLQRMQAIQAPEVSSFGGGIFGQMIRTFTGVADSIQMDVISMQLMAFGASILLLSTACLNIAKIIKDSEYPMEDMFICLGTLYLMLVGLYAFIEEINKVIASPPAVLQQGETANAMFLQRFNPVVKMLRTLVGVLIPMTVLLKVIGNMRIDHIGKGLFGLAGMIGFLYAGIEGLMKIVTGMQWVGPDSAEIFAVAGKNMMKTANSMVLMAAAVGIMSIPMIAIGKLDLPTIGKGILGTVLLAGELFGVTIGFAKLITPDQVKSVAFGALAAVGIATAIGTMAVAFIAIGKLLNPAELLTAIAGMYSITAFLIGGVVLIANTCKDHIGAVLAGSGAAIMMAVAVDVMVAGFLALTYSISKLPEEDKFENLGASILTMVSVVRLLVGGLGLVGIIAESNLAGVLAGAGALMMISAAVGVVALAVIGMAKQADDIREGLIGLLGMLSLLELFMIITNALPIDAGKMALIGLSMTTLGIGLNFIADAGAKFGEMSWQQILAALGGLATSLAVIAVVAAALSNLWAPMVTFGLSIAAIGAGLILMGMGLDAIHTALHNIANDPYVRELGDFIVENLAPAFEDLGDVIDWCKEKLEDFWNTLLSNKGGEAIKAFFQRNPVLAIGFGYKDIAGLYGKNQNESDENSESDEDRTSNITMSAMGLGGGLNFKNINKAKQKEEVKEEAAETGKEIGEVVVENANKVVEERFLTNTKFKPSSEFFKDVEETGDEAGKKLVEHIISNSEHKLSNDEHKLSNGYKEAVVEGLSDESLRDEMHRLGNEHAKDYADSLKEEVKDDLQDEKDGFKVTIHNLKAGGLEDIDEWTQLGVFHGKQYIVSFLKEIEDGKESIRTVLMELGTYRNGKFTEGSYLAALDAARGHSDAALAEFNKWVETDEQGNVTGGIFNYANTGGTAAEQYQDWLDRQNRNNAKEVKKGIAAWFESLGLGTKVTDYIKEKADEYAEKLGASGSSFNINDAITSFQTAWGANFDTGEGGGVDVVGFSGDLEEAIAKATGAVNDYADVENNATGATKKATSATKSLSSAQSEYNSKVREFESIAKSYGDTVINLMTSIKNSITDMGGELSAEWADARGRAYATAFIAATNKAYDKARKEEKEAEEAERVTVAEDAKEVENILQQDRKVQANYANAMLNDAKESRKERDSYKSQIMSIGKSGMAAVEQYNKTNRSGQIKAKRTVASENDPDYWRNNWDNLVSALNSLENEILDSAGYYKKGVTSEQIRLHEQLLGLYNRGVKAMSQYEIYDEKSNRSYSKYETVYRNLYDEEGDLYKDKQAAKERVYYSEHPDELVGDINDLTEEIRLLKEGSISEIGLTEDEARKNRAEMDRLYNMIYDKNGKERFGVDPLIKARYERLLEDTSGAEDYLRKIDEKESELARKIELNNELTEETNDNIERQSEEADYEASRSEANGEVTDQLFDLDKGQMKEARNKLIKENNELTKQINILNGRISELEGKTDERSKQERANLIADKAELEMQRSANKELIGILKNPEELGKQQRRDADVVKAIEEAMANGTIANAKSIRVFDTATGKYFDVTKSYGQPDDAEARKAITGMFDSIKLAIASGKFDNSEFLESIFANADDYISLIGNPSWEYILSELNDTDKIVNTIRAAINNGEAANTRTMTIDGKYITLSSGQTWDDKINEIINSSVDNIKNGMLSLITGGTETWGDVLNRLKRRQTNREKDINAVNAIGNPDILEDEGGEENSPYAIEETTESFAGLKAAADELAQSFKDAKDSFKGIADTIQKSENNKTLGYTTNDPAIQYAIDVLGIKPPSESEYISQWEKKNNLVKVKTDNGTEKYVKADSEEAKNKEVATGDGHNVATIAEASKANANAARDIVEAKTKIDPIAEDTNSKLDALVAKVNDIYTNGVNYLAAMAEIQNGMDEIADSGIYLDSKTLIGKIAPGLDRTLGGFAFRRA